MWIPASPKGCKTVKLQDYQHRFLYTGFLLLITILHHCHFFKGLRRNKDGKIQSPALLDIADNGSSRPQLLCWQKAATWWDVGTLWLWRVIGGVYKTWVNAWVPWPLFARSSRAGLGGSGETTGCFQPQRERFCVSAQSLGVALDKSLYLSDPGFLCQ